MVSSMGLVALAFKEVAHVIRVFQVGGRRVLRFELEARHRWLSVETKPNRHARRKAFGEALKTMKAAQ